jgi:predicted Mrr-cat superfamily restriction endonuclease
VIKLAQVWVVRGGEGNRLVDMFVDNGITAVGYYTIGDGRYIDEGDVAARLRSEKRTVPGRRAGMFTDFVHRIARDDFVYMPDTPRGEIGVGPVIGDYEFDESVPADQYRHRRKVAWIGRHRIDDLPATWRHIYKQRPTLQHLDAPELLAHGKRVAADGIGRPATERRATRRTTPSGVTHSATARAVTERVCPSCGYLKPVGQFGISDRCVDCR